MKRAPKYIYLLVITLTIFSCNSQKYIFESSSLNRQKEIQNKRTEVIMEDFVNGTFSVVSSLLLENGPEWQPSKQNFRKLNLVNPTTDTIYVNMLTDVFWDKNNYCDFMDIRIPPEKNCSILVPINADYNIYFSDTPEKNDDELLKINTQNLNRLILKPGSALSGKTE